MTDPIFKNIFGEQWHDLPATLKKHYANRPYCSDRVTVTGTLDVTCRAPLKWFAPLLRMVNGIPPYNEQNVPVTVTFTSTPQNRDFIFDRIFHFKNRKPYHFRSLMRQEKGANIIEIMPFGLCWRTRYSWQNKSIILHHRGYAFKIGPLIVPLPITWILGRARATEYALAHDQFAMEMNITHPLWGKIYGYEGKFNISNFDLEDT